MTGVLPMALAAVTLGVTELFLPAENAAEAAEAAGLTVYPARMASDVVRHLCGEEAITPATPGGFDEAGTWLGPDMARPKPAVRWRSPPQAGTTYCWSARRARAKACWPSACRASCRR